MLFDRPPPDSGVPAQTEQVSYRLVKHPIAACCDDWIGRLHAAGSLHAVHLVVATAGPSRTIVRIPLYLPSVHLRHNYPQLPLAISLERLPNPAESANIRPGELHSP